MALAQTILSALSVESLSGYDLSKRFSENSGCYWRASQQQIYRELAKLEEQNLITSETIPQEGRPDKKLYSITDLGQEHLREWIAQPSEPTPIREELLVKVLAGHLVPRSVILKELIRRRQVHLEQLAIYQELEEKKQCHKLKQLAIADQCVCLTLQRGVRYEMEWINWCDEAMQLFDR